MKCDTCLINKKVQDSPVPAACAWLVDNVVCGESNVSECPDYISIVKEDE